MNEEFKLRPLQDEKSDELVQVMRDKRVAILSGEVRSGKTLTALAMADKLKSRKVLFITKKKAITDIQKWFDIAQFNFELVIINYESVHKVDHKGVDLIICDESHSCFLENSMVDGVKIKDIKIGDYLNSFNFETNRVEKRKVLNVIKNKLDERLVKIKVNGKEIVCTENHEIYTRKGWKKAKHITNRDEVFVD